MAVSDKLRQIWYDMRHQSVVTWVTLIGTALSVFLLMVVITIQQINIMPFAPESNRQRLMYGQNFHYMQTDIDEREGINSSASLSGPMAEKLYGGLDGIEAESKFVAQPQTVGFEGSNGKTIQGKVKTVDDKFWKIFDHRLLHGRYFDDSEAESNIIIITESLARKLFDKANPCGETLYMEFCPFTVTGVVADHSPLAQQAYGEAFIPLSKKSNAWGWNEYFGQIDVALLLKDGIEPAHIKKQVQARYAELETEWAPKGYRPVYHDGPYSSEIVTKGGYGSNNTPDPDGGRKMRYITYLVLLLLPAINLGSMLHSRMRRRMSEFGIRRAFGCTRSQIIREIIGENFIITAIGGVAGWVCSMLFLYGFKGLFTSISYSVNAGPEFTLLLNWRFFAIILLVCFILNLISASVPAWQASRLSTVDAINSRQKS